jgi:exodeoxyribonuclease-3
VALLVRQSSAPEPPTFSHPAFDYESRIAEVCLPDVRVASVYVPNGGKDYEAKIRFVTAMIDYAEAARTGPVPLVICGDLNIARAEMDVHPKERKPNIIGQRPEERALFERLLDTGLVDVGRTLDPDNDALYTWWAPWRQMRERNIGWRLDYVLASTAIGSRATSHRSLREYGTSDHGPVVVEF